MPRWVTWKTAAGVTSASVLGLGLMAAAFPSGDALAAMTGAPTAQIVAQSHPERERPWAKLEAVLSALVEKRVITQAQKEAIMEALKAAHERRDRDVDTRRFVGNVLEASARYIDLPLEAIKGQLGAGKSLGEIADQRPGKSRDGLIAYLQSAAHDRIQKAVAEGKLAPEQAEQVKQKVDAMIVRIVDRHWDKKPENKGQST